MSEWKKFDSQASLTVVNIRLTKDPRVVQLADGEMVSLSVVLTSRREKHIDVWYDVTPRKFDSAKCKYLKKGDLVSFRGFPAAREWESETGKKIAHEITDAEMMLAPTLIGELKERGWVPGEKPSTKAAAKPTAKAAAKPAKVSIVDPDDDGDL